MIRIYKPGDIGTVTVPCRNTSPVTAENVVNTIAISDGITYFDHDATGGFVTVVNPQLVQWSFPYIMGVTDHYLTLEVEFTDDCPEDDVQVAWLATTDTDESNVLDNASSYKFTDYGILCCKIAPCDLGIPQHYLIAENDVFDPDFPTFNVEFPEDATAGDTATVKFTDTIAYYSFDGDDWVYEFHHNITEEGTGSTGGTGGTA